MPRRTALVLAVVAAAWSCGPGGPPSPPGLGYELPDPASLSYQWADTSRLDLDLGGQSMEARSATAARVRATFTRLSGGLRVSFAFQDFQGRFTQPMGAPMNADLDDVTGPLLFDLDRRGTVSGVQPPELTGAAAQTLEPFSMAHAFFPALPGTGVEPGATWSDTLSYSSETEAGSVEARVQRDYTLEGETVVEGRSLLQFTSRGTMEVSSDGRVQGMRVSQDASGSLEGVHLWDPVRGVLVESRQDADLRGTLRASAAPAPLGLRVRQQTLVRLDEGG